MKRIIFLLLGIVICAISAAVFHYNKGSKAEETITFFPLDPNAAFKTAQTSLKMANKGTVDWKIDSTLDRKAYLRQDAGFLFANGRLIGILKDWKQNTAELTQEKRISLKQSAFLLAITFHHAELHEKGDKIYSAQAMSEQQQYFVLPTSQEKKKGQQQLNEETQRMLRYSWNKGVRHHNIHLRGYQAFPLHSFDKQAKKGLPGFSKAASRKIAGQLWEGLYKQYALGIKKQDGTIATPIGSTIPLILLANDHTHLLVLTETADGEPILLRQMIESPD